METRRSTGRCDSDRKALETSLVEWKQGGAVVANGKLTALETSLVEWKLEARSFFASVGSSYSGPRLEDQWEC